MTQVRRATPADAAELTRLRALMFAAMGEAGQAWERACAEMLRERLDRGDGSLVAFVVDASPGHGRLAAGAVGFVERRLPGPQRPDGRVGHVGSVCTDPSYRRRGLARAVLTALVQWFDDAGVRRIELNATGEGEQLYRALGFAEPATLPLRRDIPPDT